MTTPSTQYSEPAAEPPFEQGTVRAGERPNAHRKNKDRAGDNLLPEARDPAAAQPVLQELDEDDPERRSADPSRAAKQARSARQHRGDRLQRKRAVDLR